MLSTAFVSVAFASGCDDDGSSSQEEGGEELAFHMSGSFGNQCVNFIDLRMPVALRCLISSV